MRSTGANIAMSDQVVLKAALGKCIEETFAYFNQPPNLVLVRLLMDDILEMYKLHSPFEVLKAITIGRSKSQDLYGKLNATHFLGWIQDATDSTTLEAISNRQTRDQSEYDETWSILFNEEGSFALQETLDLIAKKSARVFTNEEKAIEQRKFLESNTAWEKQWQEHESKWDQSISLEAWMKGFQFKAL